MKVAHSTRISSLPAVLGGLSFDDSGFLLDPGAWSAEIAREIAELDGLGELGREHWAVIETLRGLYLRRGALPPMRRICRDSAVSRERVKELFGDCRQVWRIAGLPHPGEEALAYMG